MNNQSKICSIYKKIWNIIKANQKIQNNNKMKFEKKWDN